MRGLIQPEFGKALAYVDWSQQEFGIAAALSGDPHMQAAYASGDPYLAFGKLAGSIPENGTKESHPRERGLFKTTTLGVQYQISANGLACKLGVVLQEAEDLLDYHHRVFPTFWEWSDAVNDYGQIFGEIVATLGWKLQLSPSTSVRTLRNFPMQANGSEMLRAACVFAANAGVEIIAPVHDAMLIEADDADIDDAVWEARQAMKRASEIVLAGFALDTDASIVRYPQRFRDERGTQMWGWMLDSLAAQD
jgi:DNA polymerase I-like protein with 3'-5' exonuclease and polymerase domains